MKKQRTFPQLAAIIVLNEIIPRWKTANPEYDWKRRFEMWPPAYLIFFLVLLELAERTDRRKTRELLDNYFEDLKTGDCKPWKWDYKPFPMGYGLEEKVAEQLIEERPYAEYFETVVTWYVEEGSRCNWKQFAKENKPWANSEIGLEN